MTGLEVFLLALVVALVLFPPKWDPAIRFKEWVENWLEPEEDDATGAGHDDKD